MNTTVEPRQLLTTEEAANYLAVTPSILVNWRCTKRVKVPFVRIGHAVRYRRNDLDKFLESQLEEG